VRGRLEVLHRAAEARAQLLRVERLAPAGGGEERAAPALLLTFDAGMVLLRADPAADALAAEQLEVGAPRPAGLVDAIEEEPWWRIIGNPLTRVWEEPAGALRMQFRADDDNPRIVGFERQGGLVRVALEGTAPGGSA
jgi:hypothetical protein